MSLNSLPWLLVHSNCGNLHEALPTIRGQLLQQLALLHSLPTAMNQYCAAVMITPFDSEICDARKYAHLLALLPVVASSQLVFVSGSSSSRRKSCLTLEGGANQIEECA